MGSPQALLSILQSDLSYQGYETAQPPPPDASPKEVAAYAICNSFLKKYQEGSIVPDLAQSRAILTFLETVHTASLWCLTLESSIDEQIVGDVRLLLYQFWEKKCQGSGNPPCPLFSIHDLGSHLRPGPGASVLANGNDFYTKLFASPLSFSRDSLAVWYRLLISSDRNWSNAEKRRQELYGSDDAVVEGSRLSVVPKNVETGRCICTEPSVNMLFQLACGTLLENRLKEVYGIGLDDQPFKNQALSRLGSRNGAFATIDLKSASDSLSMRMLEYVLPQSMFNTLCLFRSTHTRIPGVGWFELPIISTMGNGYTFPLQTILFTCIVHAVYRLHDIPLITSVGSENFGVFGDDIIVDTRVFRSALRALKLFGFTVNEDKTFSEGLFRESCGTDWYFGHPVRGFYLKRLKSQHDYYVVINRLNYWSAMTGIQLPRVCKYLLARCKWYPVPLWENDDAGIKVPYAMVASRLIFDVFTQSPLYRYCSRVASTFVLDCDEKQENPDGALVALLNGTIRNGRIAKRSHASNYVLRWNCTFDWDSPPRVRGDQRPFLDIDFSALRSDASSASSDVVSSVLDEVFLWQRWKTAAALNLFG